MAVKVHVVTPEREVWTGETQLLVARGVDGEVGVMGGHAPLLVQLAVGPLKAQTEQGEVVAVVDGGFLHVSTHDGVTRADVLASHAELAEDIDVEAARRRATELRERLDRRDDDLVDSELARVRRELRKALVRVDLAG